MELPAVVEAPLSGSAGRSGSSTRAFDIDRRSSSRAAPALAASIGPLDALDAWRLRRWLRGETVAAAGIWSMASMPAASASLRRRTRRWPWEGLRGGCCFGDCGAAF